MPTAAIAITERRRNKKTKAHGIKSNREKDVALVRAIIYASPVIISQQHIPAIKYNK